MLSVYSCEDCGKSMIGEVHHKHCITCRKFHCREELLDYIEYRYHIKIDSSPKNFKFNRTRRWTCTRCHIVFYALWSEIIESGGCVNCKLMKKYEEEVEFLHKINERERKKALTRYDMSYGETLVSEWMNDRGIKFEHEKIFPGFPHPFDFYVDELKLCIEYDGQQHIEPSKRQGGINGLRKRQDNDELRNIYCKEHNLSLVRLSFLRDDDTNLKILEDTMVGIFQNGKRVFVGYKVSVCDFVE